MRLRERLRLSRQPDETSPWWSAALVALGAGLIAGGLSLGGTWADVAIEVGAAAGVGVVVLWFKPRLMRQVDQVATQAATAVTDKFAKQFVKLENIGEVQASELRRRQSEAEDIISAIEKGISFDSANALLNHSYDQGLFESHVLVKTSTDHGRPLLEVTNFTIRAEES